MNGSISDRDDFGRELMVLNKRKYQLESKIRQLEHDLQESQNLVQHLERNLKNSEKLLWLEKERSATLENDQRSLNDEVNWLRRQNEELNNALKAATDSGNASDRSNSNSESSGAEEENKVQKKRISGIQSTCLNSSTEARVQEQIDIKNKLEWRLGEMTKNWHDAKWRFAI